MYNRMLRNGPLDSPTLSANASLPARSNHDRDINELKRELRCQECKRIACLGNCSPGHDYHQYKRMFSFSSLVSTRETFRSKLSSRPARSSLQIRPRSRQQTMHESNFKFVSTTVNPLILVPLMNTDSPTKHSAKK